MKISPTGFFALMAGLLFTSALVGLLVQRGPRESGDASMAVTGQRSTADDFEPRMKEEAFSKTADRVTMGSGADPQRPDGTTSAAWFDQLLRNFAALPDGPEKLELAHQVGGIRDRAAAPVLLEWAVTSPDRAVLRSTLDALGPMADAELIADIGRRWQAAFRFDDRYRLAKVIKSISNPEAAEALIALANDAAAPEELSRAATDALATVATPPAISNLFGKLSTAEPDETGRLTTIIARIDRPEALPALQYAAQGNKEAESDAARIAAIQALANFQDDATRDVLQRLNADPSAAVRAAAQDTLARTRPRVAAP